MYKSPRIAIAIAMLATGLVPGGIARASGFALIEQSVSNMGTAYAGGAALAEDSSTLFFNPAGMTRLPGTRGSAGVQVIDVNSSFSNNGATFALTGTPIPGSNGGNNGSPTPVPHTYISHQLKDRLWVGVAVNAPFGLSTKYDPDWVGRYHAIDSSVETYNFNPSIAYKVSDRVSVSAGVSGQYLEAELTNAIDFGPSLGAGPGQADGAVRLQGDSFGWGFNAGALIQVTDATRVGVHYRSEIDHGVEGDARFTLPNQALAGTFSNGDVRSDITLPASASVSLHHQVNSEIAIMADYTWTGWSSMPELRFVFDNGLPDGVTTFDWKDTSRVSVGGTYQATGSDWVVRAGAAFDESPIPNAAARTPRLPGADRVWLTLGAGVQLTRKLSLDLGYAHLHVDDPSIAKSVADPENVPRGALTGRYAASVNIVAAQLEYQLD